MQKLNLTQSLSQKLSPQQIQFIKLLQIPTGELESRIEEELEINPALDEGKDEDTYTNDEPTDEPSDTLNDAPDIDDSDGDYETFEPLDNINISDYVNSDDMGYKMYGDGPPTEEDKEMPIAFSTSLIDSLLEQLGFQKLSEKEETIGRQLVGSIDEDGYIRRELESIVNDLAFRQGVDVTVNEVEDVLKKVQSFDPPGIGARTLEECLFLQLKRKDQHNPTVEHAIKIVLITFDEFTKKHYSKIQRRLGLSDDELRDAVNMIIKLNPKPGESGNSYNASQYVIPDFMLKEANGKIEVSLNSRNAPELKVSRAYAEMLDTYDKGGKKDKKIKEAATFVKQKLDAAKWFIDAIRQRQETLLRTMRSIVAHQYEFFMSGDEGKLKPMILKDIAENISMDISTVSRVANSKFVQTEFGIYPLKFFFSESISTDSGDEVSSKEVKHVLKSFIEVEDKINPLSDDKLEAMLNERGYNIARRTVAKYREQLGIPVARLRKEL